VVVVSVTPQASVAALRDETVVTAMVIAGFPHP
jgi:hypothetical protein